MVRDTAHAETFTSGIASNSSKVGVKHGADISVEESPAVLCAEGHMNKNKRERLRHRNDYRSGLQPSSVVGDRTWGFAPGWYSAAPLALMFALTSTFALPPAFAKVRDEGARAQQHDPKTQQHIVTIKIINAKTNKPIHDEKLNVALRADQIGSVAMPTDKNGLIEVKTGDATIIRILSNMYADCRPRGELYTNYSIVEIRSNGITTGNLCSSANPKAKPGELILFEIPKTYVPQYPHPPATHLPHSDENPN